MTKQTAKDQPSLLDGESNNMKDVTPSKPKTSSGHQAKTDAKAPKNPPIGGSSGKPIADLKPRSRALAPVRAAAPMPEGKSVLAMIADAASRPDFNPENMRALLDMQKEIMAEQQRRDFNTAFSHMQAKLPSIRQDGRIEIRAKDGRGERTGPVQQATPYATFNNIMKVIKPILSQFGFSLWFATEPAGERILVKGFLDHDTGGQRTTAFPLPAETSGSKNNVQGWGSSLSYGKRYATIALLNIVSHAKEDRDDDGHGNASLQQGRDGALVDVEEEQKLSKAQVIEMKAIIEDCRVGEDRFCSHYGIEDVADLPASLFEAAKKQCHSHKEKYKTGGARG